MGVLTEKPPALIQGSFRGLGRRPHPLLGTRDRPFSHPQCELGGVGAADPLFLPITTPTSPREGTLRVPFLPHPSGRLASSVSCEHSTPRLDGPFIFAKLFPSAEVLSSPNSNKHDGGLGPAWRGGGGRLHPQQLQAVSLRASTRKTRGPASRNAGGLKEMTLVLSLVAWQSERQPGQ